MQIAERARALLRDAEEVMEMARAGRSPMTGEMRLGVIPTISPFLLPRVLPVLRGAIPGADDLSHRRADRAVARPP